MPMLDAGEAKKSDDFDQFGVGDAGVDDGWMQAGS